MQDWRQNNVDDDVAVYECVREMFGFSDGWDERSDCEVVEVNAVRVGTCDAVVLPERSGVEEWDGRGSYS